jgi:hypothetical protein
MSMRLCDTLLVMGNLLELDLETNLEVLDAEDNPKIDSSETASMSNSQA